MQPFFDKKIHNLDILVKRLGTPKEVIRLILKELNGKVPYNGIIDHSFIFMNQYKIHIRGKMIDGTLKIGTIFIP